MITTATLHKLHLKFHKKNWTDPIRSLHWYYKRRNAVEAGELSFKEMIELPRSVHWYWRLAKRNPKSLMGKCAIKHLEYQAVYRYMKKHWLNSQDFFTKDRDYSDFML